MRSLSELWPRQNAGEDAERTAFVLSGGAAMGALQVGMLRALIERRIVPDLVVGCSVGALNGVILAGGASLATVGRMQDVWMELIHRELVPTGLLPSPVQLVRKGESISSNDGLRNLISELLPAATFEDLTVPFQCVATDIDAGAEAWFDSGDLLPAVMASASIPAVFPAVEIDGRRYLDGAIVDDVPVRRAVELGATKIYVLQVGAMDQPRSDVRRPIDVALLAYWIARRHRLLDDLARIPEHVELVVLPHGGPQRVRFDDLSSSTHLMDVAYRASSDHLDGLAEGRIEPTFGPFQDPVLTRPMKEVPNGDDAGFVAAQRLLAAARDLIGRRASDSDATDLGEPVEGLPESIAAAPVAHDTDRESRGRLMERAEALGPATRALIARILERGGGEAAEENVNGTTEDDVDKTAAGDVDETTGDDQPAEK